jgi:excisionase family DNA binding protein
VWRVDRRRLEEFVEKRHEETARWVASHPLIVESPPRNLRMAGPRPFPEDAEVLTAVQAAGLIGVTRQNVNHLIKTGSLRARKVGRRWLVSADDARAYRALGQARAEDSGVPS